MVGPQKHVIENAKYYTAQLVLNELVKSAVLEITAVRECKNYNILRLKQD